MKSENSPAFEEIAVIEKSTGGKIGTYEWWVVKGVNNPFKTTQKPSHEADIIDHSTLENVFMSQGGEFIGGFDQALWYQKHRLKVYVVEGHSMVFTHKGNCKHCKKD
jgi:hypothetical protein